MPRKNYPAPELADVAGRDWAVYAGDAGEAHTSFEKQYVRCPLDDSPHSRFLRTHEMAHVKWTPDVDPRVVPGVPSEVVQVVEDMRIHHLLAHRALVDLSSGGLTPKMVSDFVKAAPGMTDADCVLAAVAAYGTGDYEKVLSTMTPLRAAGAASIASRAHDMMLAAGVDSFDAVIDSVARWLVSILAIPPGGVPRPKGKPTPGEMLGRGASSGLAPDDDDSDGDGGGDSDGVGRNRNRGVIRSPWVCKSGPEVKCGKMIVEEPERTLASSVRKNKYRAEDCGVYLRNPHRFTTDGRVFSRRRNEPAVSLLIDASGSMNLSETSILRVLTLAPAAVVAVYSGNCTDGVLRVLAAGGRRVTGNWVGRPAGGGNVIDVPALEWLATKPGPRFWLSDGQVTGIGDGGSASVTEAAAKVVSEAKIVRYGKAADVVRAVVRAATGRR